jgi:hypothetical protein
MSFFIFVPPKLNNYFFGMNPTITNGRASFAGTREGKKAMAFFRDKAWMRTAAPAERNGQNARFLPTGREWIREPLSAGKTAQHSKDAKRMLAFLAVSVNHEQESGRKTKHEMSNQND